MQYLKVKYTLQKLSVVVLLILSIYLILIEWLYPTNNNKKQSNTIENKTNNTNQTKQNESNNTTALDKTEEEKNKSKDNPYNIPDDF